MIFEAVAYAQGKIPQPPYELKMYHLIKEYGAPLGGWAELPAGLPEKMNTAQAYSRAFQLYQQSGGNVDWINANRQVMELVTRVWQWRKDAGLHFTG